MTAVRYWVIFICLVTIGACVKPPEYPIEPRIEFTSMNENAFDEFDSDSLYVKFYFEDGDGDLGGTETDSVNMFWEDSRIPGYIGITFKIPYIQLQGSSKAISGYVTTARAISACIGATIDTFHYNIYITDRAGHESNIISTPDIYLNCN